jgi:hypothetical protein
MELFCDIHGSMLKTISLKFRQLFTAKSRFDRIDAALETLDHYLRMNMAQVADVEAALASIQTDLTTLINSVSAEVTAFNTKITDLQAQIAAGGSITAAQLDPLITHAQAIDAAIKAATPATPPA